MMLLRPWRADTQHNIQFWGATQILAWSWNSGRGLAPYPCIDIGESIGVLWILQCI